MHNLEMNDANLKWRDWAAIWSQLTTIWPRLTVASNREGATVNLFGHVKRYLVVDVSFYGISIWDSQTSKLTSVKKVI